MKKIISYIAVGAIYLISPLPYWFLYRFSDFTFIIIYYVFGYRKKVVYENIKNSFPEKSDKEIKDIQWKFFRQLIDIMFETIKEFTVSNETIKKHYKFINPEVFQKHYDNKRSVMMVMGHYNNWEYGVTTSLWTPHECWTVYGKLEDPIINKHLVKARSRFGFTLFTIEETYDVMLKHKQGDKLYMFMSDQGPHVNKIKYWLNFLNQDTPVHLGAEKLSKMLDLAVIFINVQRVKRGYYEITAETLFENPKETQEYEITKKYFEVLEQVIIKNPENWLWSHRRWKNKRKDN